MDVLAKKILDLNFDPKLEESRVVLSQVHIRVILFLQHAPAMIDVNIIVILFQLVEASTSNEDTTILIGPVMKLLPVTDVPVKKAIHHILPRYARRIIQLQLSL
jgi:hypothetical protein